LATQTTKPGPLRDFLTGFASFFQGMWVTGTNLIARGKITVQYPYERVQVSPRYRGLFYMPYDEEGNRLKCTGCTLCEQACPTNVISMTKLGSGKHGSVSEFDMDLGRCMFCNLCVEACPFEAIYMGPNYELASYRREGSLFHLEDLAVGGAEAVRRSIENLTALQATEAAEKAAKAKAAGSERAAHARPEAVVATAGAKVGATVEGGE
jgi:NADH-quinone oxidoreductase subunit I